MNRTVLAAAVALVLGSTLYVAAQQPGAPPAGRTGAAPGAPRRRRGGGPPGGGPENGMNTRPPNAPDQKPAFAGPDARARAEAQRRVRRRHGGRGAREPVGPRVPARRQDARHREAGTAARRQRRRQDDVGAGRRPAGGRRARPGRPARRRARPGVPEESADLLELLPSRATA